MRAAWAGIPAEVMKRDSKRLARVGLICMAVSLVPLAFFGVLLRSDLALRYGPGVDARVVEVLHLRESSRGPPETSSIRVAFTTADGRATSAVVRTTRESFAVGDSLRISYDPSDPVDVRAVEGSELAWRVPLIAAATVWFVAGIYFWIALTLRLGRPSRYYRKEMGFNKREAD